MNEIRQKYRSDIPSSSFAQMGYLAGRVATDALMSIKGDITKDSVGRATTAGFAINTKHVRTQVLIENGGTVVIGGIFEQLDREDVTKVPWLGDLPYLGYLFKTKTLTTSKTELLIFLTPKVITDRTAAR